MKLSICILSYNRLEEVKKTLGLISESAPEDHEVIVVDNASNDGTADMLRTSFPRVELIALNENVGAPALNKGFEAARGDYILVLDDDSHPETGLQEALAYLDANPKVGLLACKIVGGYHRIQSKQHLDLTMGFIGCGAILRRKAFLDAGGYADWIFLYANEFEHAIRIFEAGYELRYFEQCEIRHRVAITNRSAKRLRTHTVRNELLIIHRYFQGDKRMRRLIRRTVFWNSLFVFKEDRQTLRYVRDGYRLFREDRDSLATVQISAKTRDAYAHQHWSTQPYWPWFLWRALASFGLLKEPPRKPMKI